MRAAEVATEATPKTTLNHRDWYVIPSKTTPNCFDLKTKTGNLLCTLVFSEKCNTPLLNLIASAPELQDIAEMYHDHMLGGQMQKSMIFDIVREILNRLK